MLRIFPNLLLIFIASLTRASDSETLEVIVTQGKLPLPRTFTSIGYDGNDSIYLWQGVTEITWALDILKYSISSQTIERSGGTPPFAIFGSGCWIGNNNFVHMGGYSSLDGLYYKYVWNFGATNPSHWMSVANLTYGLARTSIVWDEGENTYIIGGSGNMPGGYSNTILKYSSTTQTVVNVGVLPNTVEVTAVVWDSTTGSAYIFGGEHQPNIPLKDILKFDAANGGVKKLSVALPIGISYASAVWNGTEAYIIGGTTRSSVTSPPIVRFNPITNKVTPVSVNNFPIGLYQSGCVFVKKLNRIYIFGGRDGDDKLRDEIMYIDLNEIDNPPTTTEASTTTRPVDFECPSRFGFYSDPKNCRGFYECWFSTPHHYCCPLHSFYNTWTEECDSLDMVECHNDPYLPCDSPPPDISPPKPAPEDTSQSSFVIWYIIIGTAAVIISALVIYCHFCGKYHHCHKLQKDEVEDEVQVIRPHDPLPTAAPQSYFEDLNQLEFNQNSRQLRGPFTPIPNLGGSARATIPMRDHRAMEAPDFEEPPPSYSSVMNE